MWHCLRSRLVGWTTVSAVDRSSVLQPVSHVNVSSPSIITLRPVTFGDVLILSPFNRISVTATLAKLLA